MTTLVLHLAQAAPEQSLLQYGALGVLALLAIVAVRVLFREQTKAHDRDRARADRLEEALHKQNELIQERLVVTLTRATEAIADFLDERRPR